MKNKKDGLRRRIWRFVKRLFLFLFVFHLAYIVLLKWIDPPITITQLGSWLGGHGLKRDYVDFSEMSFEARLAVIASEDQKFATHSGFDWVSIDKAMKHNEKKPKKVRGASSISQQVAKNVFLWQGRSWIRKGLEVYFTKMIEWIWGKKRILEVYLNVVEMGKGVFGIEAAARRYYKKPASKLTRREAAMIAAVLPNPKVYGQKPSSGFMQARGNWIVRQMNNLQGNAEIRKIIVEKREVVSRKS
ncbi:MAG TPA: monofunctional biosynthetic peptidoglycan transglycosylase [Flavisolibacter sp.]|jgi:monofunctional biosynthetic peptidoglycan transglycosylase